MAYYFKLIFNLHKCFKDSIISSFDMDFTAADKYFNDYIDINSDNHFSIVAYIKDFVGYYYSRVAVDSVKHFMHFPQNQDMKYYHYFTFYL